MYWLWSGCNTPAVITHDYVNIRHTTALANKSSRRKEHGQQLMDWRHVSDSWQKVPSWCISDQTGPKSSTGILVIYDIFGFFPQTLQGADILSGQHHSEKDKQHTVFMPDFFEGSPADISWVSLKQCSPRCSTNKSELSAHEAPASIALNFGLWDRAWCARKFTFVCRTPCSPPQSEADNISTHQTTRKRNRSLVHSLVLKLLLQRMSRESGRSLLSWRRITQTSSRGVFSDIAGVER